MGIGVRLFAIWLGLSSITYAITIPAAIAAGAPMAPDNTTPLSYAIAASYVLSAVFLWFCPMVVAHKLLPRTQYTNHLAFQAHDLARVGCGLLGLVFVAKALPSLMWFLIRAMVMVDGGSSFSALPVESKLDIAVAACEIVFAVVLVFKSGAFANLLVSAPSRSHARGEEL